MSAALGNAAGLLAKRDDAVAVGAKSMTNADQPNPTPASAQLLLEEAESLIWAMLDDNIDDAEMARLTQMLEEHAPIRQRYVDCVQMHVDLGEHYGRQAADPEAAACVLPNLMPSVTGVQGVSQVK